MLTPIADWMADFHAPVPQILGCRVGHVENIAVVDRLVRLLAVQHALQIEGGHGAAALLLANEQSLASGGVQARTPGHGKRLHHGEPLRGVDRKSSWTNHIAHHVNQPGAAHLNRIAGSQFRVVIGAGIGCTGIQHHRMRRFGIAAVVDVHQSAGIGRETRGSRDQVKQSMVEGIGIDSGVSHLAQHAHILAGVGGHQHCDLGMEQHALGHQRRFNGVRGGQLIQPA